MLAVDAYDQRMTEDNSFVMETGTPIECFSFKRIWGHCTVLIKKLENCIVFKISDAFMVFSFLCLFVQMIKKIHAYIKISENVIAVIFESVSFQALFLSIWGRAVSECACLWLCMVKIQLYTTLQPEFLFNIISWTFSHLSSSPWTTITKIP